MPDKIVILVHDFSFTFFAIAHRNVSTQLCLLLTAITVTLNSVIHSAQMIFCFPIKSSYNYWQYAMHMFSTCSTCSTTLRAFLAAKPPMDTWSSVPAQVVMESTEEGCVRTLFSETEGEEV